MDTAMVRDWVEGWVVSRGAAPAVEEPWGYAIDVGLPHHVTRHVLPDTDETVIRRLVEKTTAPGTWLKVFAAPEVIAPWLTPEWAFDDPCFLMSTTLRTAATDLPTGYRLRTWSRGGVTRALVLAADGSFAAHGRAAGPDGAETVVFDQIETSPAHRRKGLGRTVMTALANAMSETGARSGVLGATVAGRGLYESLGWSVEAPLTGVVLTSPDAA
ncbi:GNAT family N-acetyltransferase [Streptomyces venezuelae]|uniref:GNAT family N-acetyltransferase n=1 Tax=Streptomyces venezuelae TaxID=54571 RepID=A0A5P2BQU0_STRVZ|nr:GNAT family N-acetyltransferase [Streptomyces venezuelae]QES30739.1 GNAT family N-acetyltransferase [Streptomyces venezuelae]